MANASIGPVPGGFNPDAVRALDPEFWAAADVWRYACSNGMDQPTVEMAAKDALAIAVTSSSALAVKLRMICEHGDGLADARLHPSYTVRDVLLWDAGRVAQLGS